MKIWSRMWSDLNFENVRFGKQLKRLWHCCWSNHQETWHTTPHLQQLWSSASSRLKNMEVQYGRYFHTVHCAFLVTYEVRTDHLSLWFLPFSWTMQTLSITFFFFLLLFSFIFIQICRSLTVAGTLCSCRGMARGPSPSPLPLSKACTHVQLLAHYDRIFCFTKWPPPECLALLLSCTPNNNLLIYIDLY